MLLLTSGQTAEEFVVTLNEKRTLDAGFYLFVFTNLTTKSVVNKIYNFTEDDSQYPERYNLFTIDTSAVFSGQDIGQWSYDVYEQASSSNTSVTGLTNVEKGLLRLDPATELAPFQQYETAQTIRQYGN